MSYLTNQQIFTKVRNHLLAQNGRAFNGDNCAYRGEGGTKCAVGCLIADEHYNPECEGIAVYDALINPISPKRSDLCKALNASGVPANASTAKLLAELQLLHDNGNVQEWRYALDGIAGHNDLIVEE